MKTVDTVIDSKTLGSVVSLHDEDGTVALEIAKNFKDDLGPDIAQIAEYHPQRGLIIIFSDTVGPDEITGVHFQTTDPEVVGEILEMFHFGHFEKTFGILAGPEYFFHEKPSDEPPAQ